MTDAEHYTYSAVWLAFGVALLLAGIVSELAAGAARLGGGRDPDHRQGVPASTSPACTGIFRALSFIGLGLVLVGIGWLYQRLLFPRAAQQTRRPAQRRPRNEILRAELSAPGP